MPDLNLAQHFTVTAPLHPGFGSTGEDHLHDEVLCSRAYLGRVGRAFLAAEPTRWAFAGGMLAAEMVVTSRGESKTRAHWTYWIRPDDCPSKTLCHDAGRIVNAVFYDPQSDLWRFLHCRKIQTPPMRS
jgi:hypothetical protein